MKALSLTQKLLLLGLIALAIFLRFWNFDSRLTFGPEQAISLSDAAGKISDFTLLGMPYLQRQNSLGMNLFHSPVFSYSLIPLQLLFNFNPYPITVYFALLNLFTGLLLFFLSFKLFRNFYLSFLSSLLFFLSPTMIHHSLFIWIINYFPLLGLLTAYFTYRFFTHPNFWHSLTLGFLSGLGLGLDIAYAPLVIILYALLLTQPNRLRHLIFFTSALLLANLPTLIFDLRNNFFHFRVYYQFLQDYLNHQVAVAPVYYHFLNFTPLIAFAFAYIATLIAKRSRQYLVVGTLCFLISLGQLLNSPLWKPNTSVGMPPGVTLATYDQAASLISSDNPGKNFNIVTLHDFDTRANPLRYLLTYVYRTPPLSVESYPRTPVIYAFAPLSYDLNAPAVWELQSNYPYQITPLRLFGNYQLSKLTPSK